VTRVWAPAEGGLSTAIARSVDGEPMILLKVRFDDGERTVALTPRSAGELAMSLIDRATDADEGAVTWINPQTGLN
jgi:hypothetical protein